MERKNMQYQGIDTLTNKNTTRLHRHTKWYGQHNLDTYRNYYCLTSSCSRASCQSIRVRLVTISSMNSHSMPMAVLSTDNASYSIGSINLEYDLVTQPKHSGEWCIENASERMTIQIPKKADGDGLTAKSFSTLSHSSYQSWIWFLRSTSLTR